MFSDITSDDVPWLTPDGIICQCKIIDVYDADTVTLILPLKENLYKVKCRLLGIDSAEKRTKNIDEKKVSLEATEWLKNLILDKTIWVKCGGWGKYGGRMLGTLYMTKDDLDNDHSINKTIIKHGYAYEYYGKKKQKFEEWYKNENK
jgi:endonuclease YncB( thermonuclease family)